MTVRSFIKCEVCGSVIMVRTQAGWLPGHPIRIHCATCGILISGECIQDQETATFSVRFENAMEIKSKSSNIKYYIEVSGELLTSKIRTFTEEKDEYLPPPFFNTLLSMYDDDCKSYTKFKDNVLQFLYFIDNDWAFVRRIHELWINKKYDFLSAQMREYLPEKQFPLNNPLECLRGLHQLFLISFNPVLPKDFYDKTTKDIFGAINATSKLSSNFTSMLEYFNNKGFLDRFEHNSLRIISSFIEKYSFFISAISTDYYQSGIDYNLFGTTTTSFEDIKYFYQECFEVIGDFISLVIAYNNLTYRNDFTSMQESSFSNIKTLDDFIEKMKNKGNKIEFCRNDEIFNKIIRFDTDNGIRNAIGHGSYTYDGVTQVITFYPSGEMKKGTEEKIFLIEFIKKAWEQMQTIIILIEIIYQTRKLYYVLCQGICPINSTLFSIKKTKKVGRNDPCPCGSGKKYKKCCLR